MKTWMKKEIKENENRENHQKMRGKERKMMGIFQEFQFLKNNGKNEMTSEKMCIFMIMEKWSGASERSTIM